MTEAEWLAAADPQPTLDSLRDRGGAGERKWLRFGVARFPAVAAAEAAGEGPGWVQVMRTYHADAEAASGASLSLPAGAQAALLRDLFGNPFRPAPRLAPAVLSWNGGTAPKLAAAIYEGRAFDRLPVLADALGGAGCNDAGILQHCRSGGGHARGCRVVDSCWGRGKRRVGVGRVARAARTGRVTRMNPRGVWPAVGA